MISKRYWGAKEEEEVVMAVVSNILVTFSKDVNLLYIVDRRGDRGRFDDNTTPPPPAASIMSS